MVHKSRLRLGLRGHHPHPPAPSPASGRGGETRCALGQVRQVRQVRQVSRIAYSGAEDARKSRLLKARVNPMLFSDELVFRLIFAIVWNPAVP